MSDLTEKLRDFQVQESAIIYIIQLTNDFETAYSIFVEKQEIIQQLMSEFGIDEPKAISFAYASKSFEEAASLLFTTIRRRPKKYEDKNINYLIEPKILESELDQTSTTSIYLGAPGVRIEGKLVINTDRDTANSLILDWFGNKPLNPEKISTYPLYVVNDPNTVEYNCQICMEKYETNDVVLMLLPCNHYYHKSCITEFFKYKSVCPIDNIEL